MRPFEMWWYNFWDLKLCYKTGYWYYLNFVNGCSIHWKCVFSSVQFSSSLTSDSPQPHAPQHARTPYPSPTPGFHPSSISGSSAFSKSSLNMWKFMVHILLKPGLENFQHYFASVCDEHYCATVWAFFGIAFLWDWKENWPFPVLWPLLSFPNLLAYWVQHFHSIIF